ncbi:DUF3576 domain-containing protein [Candidatus Levibacter sp. Uisw_134_01]|uniref:DUF3576 domain-containing protein n=1 Tax=Candidatus Levibacter sp. Uisw_134_01 TaxID=3230999 RepID=UPI003D5AF241
MNYNLPILFILLLMTSACSSNRASVTNPITGEKSNPGLFSKDASKGISLDEILNPQIKDNVGANINGYLWRASLNILSTAPLISTDALGGVIITDWYVDKNSKNERLKITAFIKTAELKSNGIGVKVHIQSFKDGFWSETYTNKDLETKIEDNILNEARNLRNNSKK